MHGKTAHSEILSIHNNNTSPSSCLIKIQNLKFRSLIDTGAHVSIINHKLLSQIPHAKLNKNVSNINLQSVDGSAIKIVGKIVITFQLGKQYFTQEFRMAE